MAEIVKMPKLSDTMTDGVVAEWYKKVGDTVESGELLADIETDKATLEFESFQEGTILYIGVQKGESAPVESILCILGEEGENVDELLKSGNTPVEKEEKKEEATFASIVETKPEPKVEITTSAELVSDDTVEYAGEDGRLKISPLAKKLAKERGIDLRYVQGTGDDGRIVKRDIDFFNSDSVAVAPAKNISSSSVLTESSYDEPNSSMRKVIAQRLAESKFTAPHYYLMMEIDMDNAIASRKQINAIPDTKVSFNDMVVKATAMALKKHPQVNSSWVGDAVRYHNHISIGVAVAVPDGLLVPVVRFTDTKQMTEISAEVKDLAGKAKNKKLVPADWEGSTFAISNLGMFGIDEFTSIINQPNSAILSVGAINQKPVVKEGEIVVGNTMKITLACDHRTVDGATGAAFLQTLKQYLESPVTMLA